MKLPWHTQGKLDEAEQRFRQAIATTKRHLGPKESSVATAQGRLAGVLREKVGREPLAVLAVINLRAIGEVR